MDLHRVRRFLARWRSLAIRRQARELRAIYRRYSDATMIPEPAFIANLEIVRTFLRRPELQGGAIVECGTWKGGMSAALMEIGGDTREYHFFDSFQGLPPAKEIDGPRAIAMQQDKSHPLYLDNGAVSLDDFVATIARACVADERTHIHAGFFEHTVPEADLPPIAVLRLDGDWYDSTKICLDYLFEKVMAGGLIIIDDYFWWDGCSRATHDFLSERSAIERIRSRSNAFAYIIKGRGIA
jgi:O-methyltransferase